MAMYGNGEKKKASRFFLFAKDPMEKWKTKDPSKEANLLRKLRKIKDENSLKEIGKQAGLESVAREAFAGIQHQSMLATFITEEAADQKRRETALDCITDPEALADIVKSKRSVPVDIRKQALSGIRDTGCLKTLARNREMKLPQVIRTALYEHFRELVKEQGGDVYEVGLLLAGDREMPLEKRKQAYAELEAAGKGGDRLLAGDTGMPAELRLQAYERLGDQENADKIQRIMDQSCFLNGGEPAEKRRSAAAHIVDSGDAAWIETTVKTALQQGKNIDDIYMDFFVAVSKKYPDIVKKLWPQIRRCSHKDETRHEDSHSDSIHSDYISDGRGKYSPRGQHVDNKHYSDCSHSDSRNEKIHTDETDENFVRRFPPFISEEEG